MKRFGELEMAPPNCNGLTSFEWVESLESNAANDDFEQEKN